MFDCYISGTGAYVPERRLTNFDLEKLVDTSDEWIVQRTGIRERRIADASQATSDLALKAGQKAIAAAGLKPEEIEAVIVCTITPDSITPSTSVFVARSLGMTRTPAFDISAACTGFIYGLTVGSSLVRTGMYRHVLVVGAESLSRYTDYQDRNTCILFGDGAGAAVLSRVEEGAGSRLLDCQLCADGNGASLIEIHAGGSRVPASRETVDARMHYLKMQGREVFKFATRSLVELIETALERNGLKPDDLDLIVPHQVNYRIIEAALKKITIPMDRFFLNLEQYGNTSAASVPIGLAEAVEQGRLKRGDTVLLVAFGAGLTWGYNLLEW
jgi:3-oxoacyl-[acyl-carrier-protein] synthase-3